jgi:hypothetical protein
MGHEQVHRRLHEMFNGRDFDGMAEHLADRFTYLDVARGITMGGLQEYQGWLRGWTTAFSDGAVEDDRYLEGDGFCVSLFRGRGVNDGALGELPATGKPIDVAFCEVLRFDAGGKVTSGEMYYDQLSLLTQLGHAEALSRPS